MTFEQEKHCYQCNNKFKGKWRDDRCFDCSIKSLELEKRKIDAFLKKIKDRRWKRNQ
jgi:hypothetical protein